MKWLGVLVFCALWTSCALTDFASVKIMYQRVELPESRILKDLPYVEGAGADPKKHKLDLYLPSKPKDHKDWPVLVFVHGGGWETGDKTFDVAGADIYGNIGRFFASRDVGTAVVNYRLLPTVPWQDQIRDVAKAVLWVRRNAAKYGGDPKRLFLSGHSAGAQLAARVALDPEPLKSLGSSRNIVSGVIALSGAGYELSEQDVAASRGDRKSYYAKRFANGDETDAWAKEVSILRFVDKNAPPFLILYGSAEPKALIQQSEMLSERLQAAGASVTLKIIPHRDHVQTVLTMSRDEGETTKTVLSFIQKGSL